MTVKQLLPNQCDLLHHVYGENDCCLCEAKHKIEELEREIEQLKQQLLLYTQAL